MSRIVEYVARYGECSDGVDVDACENKRHADKLIKEALVNPKVASTPYGYLLWITKLWTYDCGHVEEEDYWEHPLLKYDEEVGESIIVIEGGDEE